MKHFTLFLLALIMCGSMATAQDTSANKTEYPFTLTTDAANPVLYYIYSGRDSNKGTELKYVFANEVPWGESTNKLQIVYKNPNEAVKNQLWYFMKAEDGNIMIISAEDHRMVTVASTKDEARCALMQSKEERAENSFYTWKLDYTDGCYAFQTSDGKTFLSHNGNWATAKATMGLYNANGAQDDGSRVFFEAVNAETTGIINLPAAEQTKVIYNLAGQRVNSITTPGIYIINGKKVVIK